MTNRTQAIDAAWTELERQANQPVGPRVDRDLSMIDTSGTLGINMGELVDAVIGSLGLVEERVINGRTMWRTTTTEACYITRYGPFVNAPKLPETGEYHRLVQSNWQWDEQPKPRPFTRPPRRRQTALGLRQPPAPNWWPADGSPAKSVTVYLPNPDTIPPFVTLAPPPRGIPALMNVTIKGDSRCCNGGPRWGHSLDCQDDRDA